MQMRPLSGCRRYGMAAPLLRVRWTFIHVFDRPSSIISLVHNQKNPNNRDDFVISKEICSALSKTRRGKYDLELTAF